MLFSFEVLEMRLLEHWRFVDVAVGGNTVLVGDFCQLPDIVHVRPADIDIEEYRIAVAVLLAHQILEITADGC